MKKVLSVVLALVMMLSAVSMIAVAEEVCDCTMTIGETRTVYFNGVYDGYAVIRFVAPGDGKVVITSNGKSPLTCNPVLEVYKDSLSNSGVFMGKYENNGTYHNFKYELNCEKGATYYFAIHNSLSATEVEISIKCLHEAYADGKCVTCGSGCTHEYADNIVGCCPCGEAFKGSEIQVGQRIQLKSNKDYVWFRFVPSETAPYILQSENPDDDATWSDKVADPAFVIVDETGTVVLANDANVSAENKNFNFPFMLEAGNRYFIGVKDNERKADDWYFTLASGTSHTVEVPKEVQKEVVDVEGNPVLDAEGNPTYETVIVVETVVHKLEYHPYVEATCKKDGHTPSITCKECKDAEGNAVVIAGGDVIPKATECKDDDANNYCDWCGRIMVEPEDPTKTCKCNCHKDGISNFFFKFALFFQKIFRLNSVCSCGIRHY